MRNERSSQQTCHVALLGDVIRERRPQASGKCPCFTMKWSSRTLSTTRTRARTTSRVRAGTASSSRRRIWRTGRRWPRVPAARLSSKSFMTRRPSCLEKPSWCRWSPNWSGPNPKGAELVTSADIDIPGAR